MKRLLLTSILLLPTALLSDTNLQQKFTISCASDRYLIVINPINQTWEAKNQFWRTNFFARAQMHFGAQELLRRSLKQKPAN